MGTTIKKGNRPQKQTFFFFFGIIKAISSPLSRSSYSMVLFLFQIKVVAVVIPMLFNEHISCPPTYLFTATHIKEPWMNLDCCYDDGHAYRSGIPAQPRARISDFIDKIPGE